MRSYNGLSVIVLSGFLFTRISFCPALSAIADGAGRVSRSDTFGPDFAGAKRCLVGVLSDG